MLTERADHADDPELQVGDPPLSSEAVTRHRRLLQWAGALALAVFAVRLFTPPVGGILTADSVGYLAHSLHPFRDGFVFQGYRQAAYPLWVHVLGRLEGPLGFDTIFAVALTQRLLLLVGVVFAWRAMRWWAVPLLAIVTSASFVIQTDYVLMEGFLVPISLIIGGLAASVVTGSGVGARHPRAAFVAVTALSVAMGATKLQYSATLLLACALAWLAFRDRTVGLKFALITLSIGGFLLAGIATAQTFENHRELGAWEPVGERGRAEWYGAYEAVFVVHPWNRTRPQLSEFYDKGNLYVFLHGIEASEPDYKTRQAIERERVAAMFAAAGTSRRRQELAAFLGALEGGRTDDIEGVTERVRVDGDEALRARLATLRSRPGPAGVVDAVTDGHPTKRLTLDAVTGASQDIFDDYRPGRKVLCIAALVLALAGCAARGRHRAYVLASTASLVFVCGALASGYIDNARYLVGPMTISLVGATLGARALALASLGATRGQRGRARDRAAGDNAS